MLQRLVFSFIAISLVHVVIAVPVDSSLYKLKDLQLSEQFQYIDSIPFDQIVSNSGVYLPFLHHYEKMAIEHREFKTLAKIYINLSLAYYFQGKYDENLRYGYKAIALYDSLGDRRNLGTMYGELGYQMKRRDLSKAFELMRMGIEVLEDLGKIEPLAKIYDNYGVLHEMNNNLDSAAFFYRKALSFKITMKDSLGIPYSLNNIFSVMLTAQKFDSALWDLNQSTSIRSKRNDEMGLAENYGYYGQFYTTIGNHSHAIEYNLKALDIAIEHEYPFLIQTLYQALSNNYELTNDFKSALIYHKLYKQFQDSLINLETNKTIADLEIQYQTAQKEKELIIKNQLLLRERSIKTTIAIISSILIVSLFVYTRNKFIINKRNERINIQNALIEGEQAERNRLALELHDGIANDIGSAIITLGNSIPDEGNTQKGLEKLRETHQSVRKLSHSLMPRSLKEKGLGEALKELAISYSTSKQVIDLQIIGLEQRLNSFIEFNIYRVVQEAINNIVKHSRASRVLIECRLTDRNLFVSIEDNGVGFDTNNLSASGIGLQNITNRAKMMNGNVHIRSALNDGTVVEVNVPIRD